MYTSDQTKGNVGEHLIQYLLSNFCLVRQVSNGTDSGIDLYCEYLIQGEPTYHFWIQVKSSNTIDGERKYSFKRQHIDYWQRQPVPVFVFLVYWDSSVDIESYRIGFINITEHFLGEKKKGLTIHSTEFFDESNKTQLFEFLNKEIPRTTARQKLRDGIIAPVSQDSYFKKYYSQGTLKEERNILKTIGRSASLLMEQILSDKKNLASHSDLRPALEGILKALTNNGYGSWWDFYFWLGKSLEEKGEFEGAQLAYKKARDTVKKNQHLDREPSAELKTNLTFVEMALYELRIKQNSNKD